MLVVSALLKFVSEDFTFSSKSDACVAIQLYCATSPLIRPPTLTQGGLNLGQDIEMHASVCVDEFTGFVFTAFESDEDITSMSHVRQLFISFSYLFFNKII